MKEISKEELKMEPLTGKIHSIETCGTVDGPGIRVAVFLQGCPLRCQYCHNPDTWRLDEGKSYTVEEVVKEIIKYKSYMRFSGGGVTLTGGEPLMQPEFVKAVFEACREQGIHTALDTSGALFCDKSKEVLKETDLVLLDIKSFSPEKYQKVTGGKLAPTLKLLEYTKEKKIPVWVRYVLVPGLTDDLENIKAMANYLKNYSNVEKVEILPFHKMGEYKWKKRAESYALKEVKEPEEALVKKVKDLFINNLETLD